MSVLVGIGGIQVGRVRTKLSTEYVHRRVSTPPERRTRLCNPVVLSVVVLSLRPTNETRFLSLLLVLL